MEDGQNLGRDERYYQAVDQRFLGDEKFIQKIVERVPSSILCWQIGPSVNLKLTRTAFRAPVELLEPLERFSFGLNGAKRLNCWNSLNATRIRA
jgi:hypothetical protein